LDKLRSIKNGTITDAELREMGNDVFEAISRKHGASQIEKDLSRTFMNEGDRTSNGIQKLKNVLNCINQLNNGRLVRICGNNINSQVKCPIIGDKYSSSTTLVHCYCEEDDNCVNYLDHDIDMESKDFIGYPLNVDGNIVTGSYRNRDQLQLFNVGNGDCIKSVSIVEFKELLTLI